MNRKEQILAYGALIVVCVLWGTTCLATRVAVRTLPDAWMADSIGTSRQRFIANDLWRNLSHDPCMVQRRFF